MRLYLDFGSGWQLMKMDAGSDIALNFSHDNLDNPTNYVSEYSYNLKVPCCAENNKLFNNFLHVDSIITAGGFTPTKSLPYVVQDDMGTIISTGKAYIKTIAGGYYNLSLTGSMANIFGKLLNSGWDAENTDLEYYHMTDWLRKKKVLTGGLIGAWQLVDGVNVITKDAVLASWLAENTVWNWQTVKSAPLASRYDKMPNTIDETLLMLANIVGFAPTAQGRLPGFSNDKWVELGTLYNGSSWVPANSFSLLPVLCSKRDENNEPVEEIEVEDGLVECQMGEYRSYYQQPYIYVYRLWQLYREEFAAITGGYTLNLDERWFNDTNPLLANLVYMLPRLWDENDSEVLRQATQEDRTFTDTLPATIPQTSSTTFLVSGVSAESSLTPSYPSILNNEGDKLTYDLNVHVTVRPNQSIPAGASLYASPYNCILLTLTVRDNNNIYYGAPATMAVHRYALVMLPYDGTVTMDSIMDDVLGRNTILGAVQQGFKLIEVNYDPADTEWTFDFTEAIQAINVRSYMASDTTTAQARLDCSVRYISNNTPWMYMQSGARKFVYSGRGAVEVSLSNVTAKTTRATRTGKVLSLETLFRDEKPFNVLLRYSKLMHLAWQVDDDNKTVTVKRSQDFFADIVNDITDITRMVDVSRGVDITPLSWTDNKVQLNYADSGMDYIADYAKRYGLTYGSKVIITANEIKSTTKKLLCSGAGDTIEAAALLSETVVPVGQLLSQSYVVYLMENVAMPLNVEGGESADHHGCFMYRRLNGSWDSVLSGGWRSDETGDYAYITDDLDFESDGAEWAWHGPGALIALHGQSWVKCYRRPVFDTTSPDGSVSVHFAAVRELFTEEHREPQQYLYDAVWKDYIEEVYNAQNKTVQVYAHIDKGTFDKLRRNPLVQMQNCLYMLTAVDGWGEHAPVCRLTLRQIFNLGKLTGGVLPS